jgi:hypothetical protein
VWLELLVRGYRGRWARSWSELRDFLDEVLGPVGRAPRA